MFASQFAMSNAYAKHTLRLGRKTAHVKTRFINSLRTCGLTPRWPVPLTVARMKPGHIRFELNLHAIPRIGSQTVADFQTLEETKTGRG
jgi:hypothetical protein